MGALDHNHSDMLHQPGGLTQLGPTVNSAESIVFTGFAMRSLCFLLAASLLSTLPASADVLLLDSLTKQKSATNIQLPQTGDTMRQIEQRYGKPFETKEPVGHPPITRWVYPDFTVYFERRWVIQSVLHRR